MSNEVELPGMDGLTKQDIEQAMNLCNSSGILVTGVLAEHRVAQLLRDSRQLREALAQISALAAQVEELQADLKRGLNVEFQRTTCCVCGVYKHTPVRNDDLGGYICGGCLEKSYEKAEAELAALREGKVDHEARRDLLVSSECMCGQGHKIPARIDGIKWYWARHDRIQCTMELPDAMCWCGLTRSQHVDGHRQGAVFTERILDTTGGEG